MAIETIINSSFVTNGVDRCHSASCSPRKILATTTLA